MTRKIALPACSNVGLTAIGTTLACAYDEAMSIPRHSPGTNGGGERGELPRARTFARMPLRQVPFLHPTSTMSYDERKAAQAAAHLVRNAGGRMPFLSLIKLLYLCERLSLQRYGYPVTGDHLVSMDHGPVLSRTYDHIKGAKESVEGGWDTWISDQADYMVGLTETGATGELDELSESDLEVLDEVWAQFGKLGRWQLVELTHKLPEWEFPNGSSIPIELRKLLTSLGYSEEAAEHLLQQMRHQRAIDSQFA